MSFKDELNAAEGKAAAPSSPGTDDIARLLRALNEDLKDEDPAHLLDEGPEDEEEPRRDRGVPVMKIAAALLAAVGIGLAVVLLDGGEPEQEAPRPLVAAVPVPASTPESPAGQPEPLIARAATPSPPPAAPAPEPVAAPPPAPVPAAAPPPQPPPTAAAPASQPAAPAPAPSAPAAAAPPPPAPASTAELQAMLRTPAPKAEQAPPAPTRAVAPAPRPATAAPAPAPAGDGRYAVQVGSFGVAENAEALQRRLSERGYSAYALDWTDRNQRSWRVVRVGNFRTDAEARRAAEELKARMNVPAQIVTTR